MLTFVRSIGIDLQISYKIVFFSPLVLPSNHQVYTDAEFNEKISDRGV